MSGLVHPQSAPTKRKESSEPSVDAAIFSEVVAYPNVQ